MVACNKKIEDFKLDTSIKTLRNQMARFVSIAYEQMSARPKLVEKAWNMARAKDLCLFDAWKPSVQVKALEMMASSTLFPALIDSHIDPNCVDDADEVGLDALIAALLQAKYDDEVWVRPQQRYDAE